MHICNSFYSLHSHNPSVFLLTWSLLGVKKSLGHPQIGLLKGFNSKFPKSIPTPFVCVVSPSPPPGLTRRAGKEANLPNFPFLL